MKELAHFARRALHDDIAQRDLTVSTQRNDVAPADGEYGGSVKLFHAMQDEKALRNETRLRACGE